MKQVRISEQQLMQLKELVDFTNENRSTSQPKYNQCDWLNELIDTKHKRVFGGKK